jgi:hypothetical protein
MPNGPEILIQGTTHAQRLAEAYRRGILPPEKTAAYEEAVRRGMIHDPYVTGRLSARHNGGGPLQVLQNSIPFVSELGAGMNAGVDAIGDAVAGRHGPNDGFGADWTQERAKQQGQADEFSGAHPIATSLIKGAGGAAQVAGAVLSGGATLEPTVANAVRAGLGGTVKRLAATGARNATAGAAIAGVNAAAAPGTASERSTAAWRAAGAGAVTGAVLPVAGKALIGGAQGAIRLSSGAIDGLNALVKGLAGETPTPPPPAVLAQGQDAALQWFLKQGVTPAKLDAAVRAANGAPITAAEAAGPGFIGHASGLARRSTPTGELAADAMGMRAADRGNRIMGHLQNLTGYSPGEAQQSVDAVVQAGREAADPMFAAIRAQPAGVFHPELDAILGTPAGKQATAGAVRDLQNARINPMAHGFVVDPASGEIPNLIPGPNGLTAHALDLTRQNLGDMVERDAFGKIKPDSESRGNFNINGVKRDLTNLLAGNGTPAAPGLIPGYRDALDVSGDYLSVKAAYDRAQGRLFGTSGPANDPRAFDAWFQRLTPGEQAGAQASGVNDIYSQLQNGKLRPTAMAAPNVQAKLRTMFPDRADDLIDHMTQEAKMSAASARMTPNLNSTTGDVIGSQENGPGAGLAITAAQAAGHAAKGNLAAAGLKTLDLGFKLSDLATQDQAAATRNATGAYLYGDPQKLSTDLASTISGMAAKRQPRIPGPADMVIKGATLGTNKAIGDYFGQDP